MPSTFAVKIDRLKVDIIFSQSDDLDLHSRSQPRLRVAKCFTCTIIVTDIYLGQYLSHGIQTWHDGRLTHGIYMRMLMLVTLTLMQGHSGSAKKTISVELSRQF